MPRSPPFVMVRTLMFSVAPPCTPVVAARQSLRHNARPHHIALRSTTRVPRAALSGGTAGRILSGGGGGGGDDGFGDLYASAEEMERLAVRSRDAPILARVVTYNVLAPKLASPSHFRHCKHHNLDADVRLARVLRKLEDAVAARSVICLQEVALSWSGALHTFFATRGFHLVLGTYGTYFNGYFGVALAFPTDLYEPADVFVLPLTDSAAWPRTPREGPLQRAVSCVMQFFGGANNAKRSKNPWTQSQRRRNVLIFARLRSRSNGALLCVGTYHMPCAFWSPPIMLIHSALVVSTFQKLCAGDAAILAGDFNIKPGDSAYTMITTGSIDQKHNDYPPKAPDGSPAAKWFPKNFDPMKSAYVQVNGQEPDFTNYARVGDGPEFIHTLDYLFCSQDLDVVDVLRLPHRSDVKGPFPVAAEPSDHIMIGATLRLPAASAKVQSKTASRLDSTKVP